MEMKMENCRGGCKKKKLLDIKNFLIGLICRFDGLH